MFATIEKSQLYFDYSLFGGLDNNGEIKSYWNQDALSNSLMMWVASLKGDILRSPTRGGYIIKVLTQPMSEYSRLNLIDEIKRGLIEDFKPVLTITNLNVSPDYEKRQWLIDIDGYSKDLKREFSVSTAIKNLV